MSMEQAIEAAIRQQLDGIAITEHDYQWQEKELQPYQQRYGKYIRIFTGVEVSCLEGHFLVYGLPDLKEVYSGMPAKELIRIAHQQQAVVVVAHPYRYHREAGDYCYQLDIDGVEIDSSNTGKKAAQLALRLAEKKKVFPQISSDAHAPEVIGKYTTPFPDDMESIHDLVEFIRSRGWEK